MEANHKTNLVIRDLALNFLASKVIFIDEVVRGVGGTRTDLDARSYSIQSAFLGKRQLPNVHPTPSETLNENEAFAEKVSHEKSMVTTYSSNTELENVEHANAQLETGNDGVKMENHLASSEGSAEVSQTFLKIDTLKESGPDLSNRFPEIQDDCQIPEKLVNTGDHYMTLNTENVEKGKNLGLENYSSGPCTAKSGGVLSQVHPGTNYVNWYEFARTASLFFEEVTYKSSDKTSEDAPRSVEEIVAGQLKVITNRVPEDGRDCLFIMNDRIPAVENYTCEVLGIQPGINRKNHLIDVMCHVICIEDHLQGLLLGPWLNPDYSMLWRKSVLGVADIASLKKLLLELESNLHHLALSADWRKHVDSVATMGSASHIVSSSARASSRHGIAKKRTKSSEVVTTPSSNAATGLSLFWWRGGRGSRMLFNWKVDVRRYQAYFTLIVREYAKRTKYASWRAAVRELNANIRWDEIGNTNLLSKMDKDPKKSIRSFKKVIIRRKCCEGAVVRYLLDFGKRRFIPDVVVRHGSMLEDSSSERKKYWLEESHVPLHLLKSFEEKRIARKSNKMEPGKVHDNSGVAGMPSKKKGFEYLFARAERLEKNQCGHCNKDVLIREAVSCQHCKGFFHKRHARKSAGSISTECIYTCHRCQDGKFMKTDAREGKLQPPKSKHASKKGVKPLGSGKGKKRGKPKRPVNSKNTKKVTLVIPLRRSARNAERIAKLSLQKTKVKKRKKGKQAKSGKGKSTKLKSGFSKKKRTPVNSSYWLNGVQLSRRANDERLIYFRSRMLLVRSGEVPSGHDKPQCSLCSEVDYNSELNYVACQICGVWLHGDALGLTADKIENLIGFKCHTCLNKRPPVCPHHCQTGGSKAELVSENNTKTEFTGEDSNCTHPDERSADQKPHSTDESKDMLLTVDREKQSSGSMLDSDQKDNDFTLSEKILLGNDSVELGEKKEGVLNAVETEFTTCNSDMVKEAEYVPLMHSLVKNGLTNNREVLESGTDRALSDASELSPQTVSNVR
ncbi:UNVERIFIED_CONTAM: DDT domain-containing protein PTM [Sesamum calycinum]|uniref:DDT domain-containing protein PTM n=1 Tax=Sesamum calycinum TaxID=2727403 RepID=A0AAW2NHT5_9LAMI